MNPVSDHLRHDLRRAEHIEQNIDTVCREYNYASRTKDADLIWLTGSVYDDLYLLRMYDAKETTIRKLEYVGQRLERMAKEEDRQYSYEQEQDKKKIARASRARKAACAAALCALLCYAPSACSRARAAAQHIMGDAAHYRAIVNDTNDAYAGERQDRNSGLDEDKTGIRTQNLLRNYEKGLESANVMTGIKQYAKEVSCSSTADSLQQSADEEESGLGAMVQPSLDSSLYHSDQQYQARKARAKSIRREIRQYKEVEVPGLIDFARHQLADTYEMICCMARRR